MTPTKRPSMLDAFKTITLQTPKKPSESSKVRLVAKYARGNVSLQIGRYTTEQQIEDRRNRLRDYKFSA